MSGSNVEPQLHIVRPFEGDSLRYPHVSNSMRLRLIGQLAQADIVFVTNLEVSHLC
jgi:hypothetical protein